MSHQVMEDVQVRQRGVQHTDSTNDRKSALHIGGHVRISLKIMTNLLERRV